MDHDQSLRVVHCAAENDFSGPIQLTVDIESQLRVRSQRAVAPDDRNRKEC